MSRIELDKLANGSTIFYLGMDVGMSSVELRSNRLLDITIPNKNAGLVMANKGRRSSNSTVELSRCAAGFHFFTLGVGLVFVLSMLKV